jgi:hypothetical protein
VSDERDRVIDECDNRRTEDHRIEVVVPPRDVIKYLLYRYKKA